MTTLTIQVLLANQEHLLRLARLNMLLCSLNLGSVLILMALQVWTIVARRRG